MKLKTTTSFLFLLFLLATLNTRAQIPNPGFETWVPDGNGILYPAGWEVTNFITDTCVQPYTPACAGNFSMSVKTFNAGISIFGGTVLAEFPYSQRPTELNVSLSATIMTGDTALIYVTLRQGQTYVASPLACTFRIGQSISSCTNYSFPISYLSGLTPDTAVILIMSGITGSTQLGTKLIVDEMSFGFTSGTNEQDPLRDAEVGTVFPNPASESAFFPLTLSKETEVHMILYDLLGNEISRVNNGLLSAGEHTLKIPVAELADGIYHYIISGNDFILPGKFVVNK